MAWRVFSVSTSNWTSKIELTPSASTWARALGSGKGGTTEFKVRDPFVAETATETNLAPWKRMIVMDFYGIIIYAGFITGYSVDRDAGSVSVTHEDIYSLFSRRVMADILSDGVQTRPALAYASASRAMLMKQAIYQGQNDASRFNLPIVLPSDASGSWTRSYDPWNLPTVASILDDITSTENPPDMDLNPRWTDSGSIEWVMLAGDLTSGTWSWALDVPLSTASNLKVRRDGSGMANRIAAVGEGSEKKMLLSVADGSGTSDFLPLDKVISYKDEKVQADLAARARADLAKFSRATEQVSMDVGMDADFSVNQLSLGGTVNWHLKDDLFLAPGWRSSRLIEYSGDLSGIVHLEFQST
jgi:hypothetical protein